MTTLTDHASASPGVPHIRAHAAIGTLMKRIHAYSAARKSAVLERKNYTKVAALDARLLRDIGLDPSSSTARGYYTFDGRTGTFGL